MYFLPGDRYHALIGVKICTMVERRTVQERLSPQKKLAAQSAQQGVWGTEVPQLGPPRWGFGGKAPRSQKIRDLWRLRKQFVRIFGLFS